MYLRSQTELLADIEAILRDTSNLRWSDAEIYRALNRGLIDFSERVKMPMLYTLPNGWDSTTYEYELPAYIQGPIRPQVRFDTQPSYGGGNTWTDIRSFEVEPNEDGGRTLRVRLFPEDPSLTSEGRIIWYASNSTFPITPPTLSSSMTSSDTSATVNAAVDITPAGWVKIESEWIAYAGLTRAASTTVLLNLVRAQEYTAAASHNSAVSVYFGVCVPQPWLFQHLINHALMYLHNMFLTDGAPKERDMHERMLLRYQDQVDRGWRRFTPRAPRMVTRLEHL